MSEKRDTTTMAVTPETLAIFRNFSERTKIPLLQLLSELAREISTVLKKLSESDRVIYMATAIKDKNYVVLTFANMFMGSCPESEISTEVRKKFEGEQM